MFRFTAHVSRKLVLGCLLTATASCGGNDETKNPQSGNSEKPEKPDEASGPGLDENGNYRPTRFEFVPGEPGRSVGIYATVTTPAGDLDTNPIEIRLLAAPDSAKTETGVSSGDLDVETAAAPLTRTKQTRVAPPVQRRACRDSQFQLHADRPCAAPRASQADPSVPQAAGSRTS